MSASSLSHKATQYLQTIHQLAQNGQEVRQITVARQLKVSPSTCFEGVLRLMKKKYVTEDEHKHLHLTPEGKNVLATIERNQYIFTNFFNQSVNSKSMFLNT